MSMFQHLNAALSHLLPCLSQFKKGKGYKLQQPQLKQTSFISVASLSY